MSVVMTSPEGRCACRLHVARVEVGVLVAVGLGERDGASGQGVFVGVQQVGCPVVEPVGVDEVDGGGAVGVVESFAGRAGVGGAAEADVLAGVGAGGDEDRLLAVEGGGEQVGRAVDAERPAPGVVGDGYGGRGGLGAQGYATVQRRLVDVPAAAGFDGGDGIAAA